jgi:hypothetical protein
MSTTSIS